MNRGVRATSLSAFAVLLAVMLAGCAPPATRFNQSYFKATHNSYSGGDRGSIVEQLDAGVRFVELDVHDDEFASHNDFRIGHNQPVGEVDIAPPNPRVVYLRAWLELIDDWSDRRPTHAPIVVSLDLKDDLSDNEAARGDLHFLNKQLREVFGNKLYTPAGHRGAWPTTESMRGKIVVVMSGSRASRQAYFRATSPSDYEQIAFVEFQKGDEGALPEEGLAFFAALYSPGNLGWARQWRAQGKVVRLWRFNAPLGDVAGVAPANYPATDAPFAEWYVEYARRLGAVE